MENTKYKKIAPIMILAILEKYSDPEHPITHEQIISYLRKENFTIERKALGRNLELLREYGKDIISTRKGSYIETRLFEDVELKYLIDSVLSAEYLPEKHSKDLIEKLASLSSVYFKKKIENVYSDIGVLNKSDNKSIFYTIDTISEAINNMNKVSFSFNKYNKDLKLVSSKQHTVIPMKLILKKHQYYLIAISIEDESTRTFRIDRITDINITDKLNYAERSMLNDGKERLDLKALSSTPYLFIDEPKNVVLDADESALDQIVDWFGRENILVREIGEKCRISVKTSLRAMEYWAMQYLNSVEIISPQTLRDRIKENLRKGIEKYA